MIKIASLLTCLFTFFTSSAFAENVYVIHAGSVLVIPGGKPLVEQTIVIRDNLIERIEKGYISPADVDKKAKLIDLKDQFVLPGLMDMHVHLLFELGKKVVDTFRGQR
jgi:imidazolonepropionase-like amidohydrolase